MSEEFVQSQQDVLDNIKTLIGYRESQNNDLLNYYKERMRKGKVFIVEIINGKLEFAPSKFVGYKNNNKEIHDKLHDDGRSGIDTDFEIKGIYNLKERPNDNLDQLLHYFYQQHNIDTSPYKNKAFIKYLYDPQKYEEILKLGFSTIPFFSSCDIMKYSDYGGLKYHKENRELVNTGKEIRDMIFEKTNHWARSINVDGFIVEECTNWQIMGIFTKYTWARILKPEYQNNRVFFTIGVDYPLKALVYKIDCQWRNANRNAGTFHLTLTPDQLKKFNELVEGSGAEWQQINLEDLNTLSWNELKDITENFIREYEPLYDRVIRHIWGAVIRSDKPSYNIEYVNHKVTASPKPKGKGSFGKTDWMNLHKERSAIGLAGEEFVVEIEKEELRKCGKNELADQVEHTSKLKGDGYGYDIKSYEPSGEVKYIEVKTTKSSCNNPIYISNNELIFSCDNSTNFYLYRVYNFDKDGNSGDIKVIKGYLKDILELEAEGYKSIVQ